MTTDVTHSIKSILEAGAADDDLWAKHELDDDFERARIRHFEDAHVLTRDAGSVVKLKDGTEFQITVIRSR